MSAIRDKARRIIEAIPHRDIRSNDGTGDFAHYTGGVTQKTLDDAWKAGSNLTCCNAFAGWYGRELGSAHYLGRFDLEKYLPTIDKGSAWVKSCAERRPRYGDILIHAQLHEDVALDFDGDVLTRIAAGQGGKRAGCDILKRVRGTGPYDWHKLLGWLDIDIYFDESIAPAPVDLPVPPWLPGWWTVTWRGRAYYYHFNAKRQVRWTDFKPMNTALPPTIPKDSGAITMDIAAGVTVRWNATGSVERFALQPVVGALRMGGTWNGSERLEAVKLG